MRKGNLVDLSCGGKTGINIDTRNWFIYKHQMKPEAAHRFLADQDSVKVAVAILSVRNAELVCGSGAKP
ncbi:hypothetical protein OQA88_1804 [Cercophora sp. LCS_1]